MIQQTDMTIDAYLRQAGIKTRATEPPKNFIPLKHNSETRFSDILDSTTSNQSMDAGAEPKGVTIADYLSLRSPSTGSALSSRSTISKITFSSILSDRHLGMSHAPTRQNAGRSTTPDNLMEKNQADSDTDKLINRSIRAAANKYNLSEELIASIIRAESSFQPDAVSPAGAQGLMQLMPATARELGVTDPFDVHQNIDGGSRYIRQMLDRFGGDVKLALAAYNAGPGTVMRYDGNVPYPETQNYVQRVLSGMA